jgi:hypothetical protein
MTPLGVPDVPDVYSRVTKSEGPTRYWGSGSTAAASSTATQSSKLTIHTPGRASEVNHCDAGMATAATSPLVSQYMGGAGRAKRNTAHPVAERRERDVEGNTSWYELLFVGCQMSTHQIWVRNLHTANTHTGAGLSAHHQRAFVAAAGVRMRQQRPRCTERAGRMGRSPQGDPAVPALSSGHCRHQR